MVQEVTAVAETNHTETVNMPQLIVKIRQKVARCRAPLLHSSSP